MRCSMPLKFEILRKEKIKRCKKILDGIDYIYKLNRLPRVYSDELS